MIMGLGFVIFAGHITVATSTDSSTSYNSKLTTREGIL